MRWLTSDNILTVCPGNRCFPKHLLVLSLCLELVTLGDPGVSQNLEKIPLYVQYKTGTYTLLETIKSIHKKIALTLKSVQYKYSHLQSDHLFGILTISIAPLPLHYS